MKFKIIGVILIIVFFVLVVNYDSSYTIRSVDYNGENLRISIDGENSNTLPTSGDYYLVSYDCESDETKISWDREIYELKVSNGNKKSGVSCYLDFQTNPLLSYISDEGNYVEYEGKNGCSGVHCSGTNANYVEGTNNGYCYYESDQFYSNGWRIAYIKDNNVYLVSAGAPECLSSSSYSSMQISDLDEVALKYCDADYVFNGVCNNTSVWAMDDNDFYEITGYQLTDNSCYGSVSATNCNLTNELISNGGDYLLASQLSGASYFYILTHGTYLYTSAMGYNEGIRPVIKLDSNVVVTGGDGTYEDPYVIGNNSFTISETSTVDESGSRIVTLNLVTLDTVTQMCVNVDSSSCSNYVDIPESKTYDLDLSSYGTGERTIYVYYKDANGKIVASMHKSITLS